MYSGPQLGYNSQHGVRGPGPLGGPGSPKEGARDAHRGSTGVKKKRREGKEIGRKKKKK